MQLDHSQLSSKDMPAATGTVDPPQSLGTAFSAFVGGVLLVVWLTALGLIIASLMTGHWVVLPHPKVGSTLGAVEASSTSHKLTAYHFLYADCPCSRRVLRHIVDREVVLGIGEKIVLIGEDERFQRQAKAKGFEFESVAADDLEPLYGVKAAPLLVVTERSGAIVYSGGYTTRKQGYQIRDVETLTALVKGDSPSRLPVYGCAVSRELQALVDPFRLKYIR